MGAYCNQTVLDLCEYVKKYKLKFRPDLPMLLLNKFGDMMSLMIQTSAPKDIITSDECKFCIQLKQKSKELNNNINSELLCKKHNGINSYFRNIAGVGILNYNNIEFQLVGDFLITNMPTDPNGLFMIHITPLQKDDSKISVFALPKKVFISNNSKIKTKNITSDIMGVEILTVADKWGLNLSNLKIERLD